MLKPTPTSLNQISYDGVIRMLSAIKDASPNPPLIGDVFIDTVGKISSIIQSRLYHSYLMLYQSR